MREMRLIDRQAIVMLMRNMASNLNESVSGLTEVSGSRKLMTPK